MPLLEERVKLNDKRLIACRDCSSVAHVSIEGSKVTMMCPKCHTQLGTWETTEAASIDIKAFLGKTGTSH